MTDTTDKPWHEGIATPALLRHARNTYAEAMRSVLDAAGYDDVPGNGLYIIGGLALGAGDLPLGQLIRELKISKQAAGQLVDALVLRGYLERTTDASDRRKLTVSLTQRGRAAAAVQNEGCNRIDALLTARVGSEVVAQMRLGLAGLIDIAQSDRRHHS